MLVKPARGLAVRDPELMDLLPADGREVPRNDYWLRRIADGDVREADDKPADKKDVR
jgi:hypothetical protein